MKIEAGSKLVMIGDSITDCGRARPVGEGFVGALGAGYVANVDALLGAVYPEQEIRVVNMGVSGNTVRDLAARWETDVLNLQPDWVSIMIGVNDVWRHFDLPYQTEIHVGADEYRRTLDELVTRTLPTVRGMVLMTPFFIEPKREDAMRARIDDYGALVQEVAEAHGTVFVNTQAAFDRVLKHYYAATLAWDRVHPNHIGHMVAARAFLNAIGFEWKRG